MAAYISYLKMPQWTSTLFLNNPSADTNFGGPLEESVLIPQVLGKKEISAAAHSECIVGKKERRWGEESTDGGITLLICD